MGTSLQQGIDAAKAGKLGLALEHLKNAVVEEPENPEVWVWLSGIIDDEEKQTVFLKKALELDPDNRSAQRGLAYLQRQKYVPSQHLASTPEPYSDKSPANPSEEALEYADPDFLTVNVEAFAKRVDAIGDPQAPSKDEIIRESKALTAKPKTPWLDILIYGVTLIVFAIIGVLIGATIKNRNAALPVVTATPALTQEIPGEGVFLFVDNRYFKMELLHNKPAEADGIPRTTSNQPEILINSSVMIPSKLRLLDEDENVHGISNEQNKDSTYTLIPVKPLTPGRYCLVPPISDDKQTLYWCFRISD